ncbi:hypothetical protein O181_022851 [Austropuccinia psidii MF-1]|uniref:Uncharacterized protein n=1 Tax=Austropuccinia psidii MF-1 TaxID=1389203 RepID=A0A9Q3CDQ6_9BASI|nr:hypothetical protein [Austropuccinia psidii MF-1]
MTPVTISTKLLTENTSGREGSGQEPHQAQSIRPTITGDHPAHGLVWMLGSLFLWKGPRRSSDAVTRPMPG